METEKELNEAIINITMKINDNYPELSKYIKEMPVKISNDFDSGITIKNLKLYYDSLNELLNHYAEKHKKIKS